MKELLKQIKNRRIELGLKQQDMKLCIGISRQQYQKLESNGNPRLDTLELVIKGLASELMLIPREKVDAVKELLDSDINKNDENIEDDPWKGLLEDD